MSHQKNGFSLVEMLVVLAIIAMVVAVSFPWVGRGGDSQRVVAAALEIASIMQRAKSVSIKQSRSEDVEYDRVGREWSMQSGGKPYVVPAGLSITLTSARQLSTNDIWRFRFFPDGGNTGGEIVVKRRDAVSKVSVNWLSGAISVTDGSGEP